MKNYQCRKCGQVLQSDGAPNSGTCPEGGSHSWEDLGKVGGKNYQCRKCNETLKSESSPNSGTCPNGGSHSWSQL